MKTEGPIRIGDAPLSIEEVVSVATRSRPVELSTNPEVLGRIEASAALLEKLKAAPGGVYGVTTGLGDSVTVPVPAELVDELSHALFTYHGVGLGPPLSPMTVRAVLATRAVSLAAGYSGVRVELVKRLIELLRQDVLPVIPEGGSVGASGDLTPLSYVAAVLAGERDVFVDGLKRDTPTVFAERGLTPIRLTPKEGLALMNGTAVMTAQACLAFSRAQQLVRLASRLTAMVSLSTNGNPSHFDDALFAAKPHPGQRQVAKWVRSDLPGVSHRRPGARLQDRYSLRCAAHVIGVLADSLPWLRSFIEIELNSANDNPLFDVESGQVMHGGHFYGGHIAFAMDSMKAAVASIADLMDRQLALLVDARYNDGLPANLSGASEARRQLNHGFKAVQIGASAYTAEALRLTMPAASFSRSTECHNQDKVSMGSISARDALSVLELTERVAASLSLAAAQGVELRIRSGEVKKESLQPGMRALFNQIRGVSGFLTEDRVLEHELKAAIECIQTASWQ